MEGQVVETDPRQSFSRKEATEASRVIADGEGAATARGPSPWGLTEILVRRMGWAVFRERGNTIVWEDGYRFAPPILRNR